MEELVDVETVTEAGSWLFTASDPQGDLEEVVVVPCEEAGVRAWVNRCTHEAQRFDRGDGAPIREGQLICPRHGSMFDTCEGDCDNGPAAGTTLSEVDVATNRGTVLLTDDDYTFASPGSIDDDDGPGSTSHLQL